MGVVGIPTPEDAGTFAGTEPPVLFTPAPGAGFEMGIPPGVT
jgi:hypothetical protein